MLVSADCARCGGAVSWLRRLRTFLFQPVACQQVVGFCLAIWVYAGVNFFARFNIHDVSQHDTLDKTRQRCMKERDREIIQCRVSNVTHAVGV